MKCLIFACILLVSSTAAARGPSDHVELEAPVTAWNAAKPKARLVTAVMIVQTLQDEHRIPANLAHTTGDEAVEAGQKLMGCIDEVGASMTPAQLRKNNVWSAAAICLQYFAGRAGMAE